MPYGSGGYGTTAPWGGALASIPAPTLVAVGPTDGYGQAYAEEDGGTVLSLTGTGFYYPIIVDVLRDGTLIEDKLGKPARAFVYDPERELRANVVYAGMPSLDPGFYDIRVTTPSGTSNTLSRAVEYRLYAEQFRVVNLRGKFSATWRAGVRFLRG